MTRNDRRGGRTVPEIRREDVRETFVRAYRIVYQIRRRDVRILTIFEGHRRFPSDVDPDPKEP